MDKLNGISTSHGLENDRIKTNGQVFTPDSIVNDMLDESDRKLAEYFGVNSIDDVSDDNYIDYVVLEPTCGNGQIIIRELDRKLERVAKYTGKEQEIALLRAVASIHGVDITADNVVITKLRMLEVIEKGSTQTFELEYKDLKKFRTTGFELSTDVRKSIKYILDRNIQCGDILKSKRYNIWKATSIRNVWRVNTNNMLPDALFRTTDLENELCLTQYDFTDNKVAIRERTYKNMHESVEKYQNESEYVEYDKIYTLKSNEIYKVETESTDEFDF